MRKSYLALIALLLFAASTNAQVEDIPKAHPFKISSVNTAFAMQGEFEGEYRIYPDRIEFNVTKADIRIGRHCPYKGRRLLSGVRFNLAVATDEKRWRIAAESNQYFMEHVMLPGDARSLGELYFNIPIDPAVDLSKHWLVVIMGDDVLDLPATERRSGYAVAKSCRDIFTRTQ